MRERSERVAYDYAVVRVVPRVDREEFVNAGVIVFCRVRKFLEARIELDVERLRALAPNVDIEEVRENLSIIPGICSGAGDAGPIAALPIHERWHWLVAPRSTIIQTGSVHSGLCEDPTTIPDRLLASLVRVGE